MPLSGSAFWAVVIPVGDRTNLISNPSFEYGTQGWGTLQAGTIGSIAGTAQFGAWAGSIAPTSNGTAGAISPTFTAGAGTLYAFSAYVRGQNGIPYRLAVGDSNGQNFVGSITFTGGGTFHRIGTFWTEGAGATRRVVLTKAGDANTGLIVIDGVQVEAGSITSYIDGDEPGCYWFAAPHVSQSTRSGTYRGGGTVIALADLGLKPHQYHGIGMPPQDITAQSYALQPGAEYQRSRASERPFTLTFSPILGTTQQDFHITRRTIINAIKPDLVSPQQPVTFLYTGAQGTSSISAVYQTGLDFGELDGPMAENGAIKFIAHDPYWSSIVDQGTALSPRTNIGSANYIVKRDSLGRWGTLGQTSGSTFQNMLGNSQGGVRALLYNNGTVFCGGSWGTVAGTTSPNLAQYYVQQNLWGTFTGGTLSSNGLVRDFAYAPWGSLFVGGILGVIGGTTTKAVGQWNGAWGTLTGGTWTTAEIWALALNPGGTLFVGGDLDTIAGTAVPNIAFWINNAWGTLGPGTVSSIVRDIAIGLDGKVYLGGNFTLAGGTTAARIAQWGGSFGTMGAGMDNDVYQIAVTPDGQVIATGIYTTAGGGTAPNSSRWNGQQWFAMGSGLQTITGLGSQTRACVVDQQTGAVYVGGVFKYAGGLNMPDSFSQWNGYAWLPMDIDIAATTNGTFHAITIAPDKSLYAAGSFAGTANCASVAQIVNSGMAEAYPTVVWRNTGAGTARIYQIGNVGQSAFVWFDVALLAGEVMTLTTEPGNRTLTSNFRPNLFNSIIPGSSLTSFTVPSGTSYISSFCDSDNVAISFYWRNRHDSVDGGTIY